MDTNDSSTLVELLNNKYFHKVFLHGLGFVAVGLGLFYLSSSSSSPQKDESVYLDEESLTQLLQSIYNETTYFGFNLHESRLDYQLDETNVVFKTFLNKRVKKESGLTTEQLNQKLLDLENEAVSTHGIPLEVYLKSLQQHLPKSQLLFKKKSSANSQGIG